MEKYKFNPIDDLDLNIPSSRRREALEAAADLIKEEILEYIGNGNSPVSGHGKFPGYTKDYKSRKSEESSSTKVNLELSGEMLDALDVKFNSKSITIGVFGDSEIQGKAEGNNLGTYGNNSPIPGKARRFIPLNNESLKRDIISKVRTLLKEYEDNGSED